MADRPILFSASMVQALLREARQPGAGKTQTRRLLKPQPPEWATFCEQPSMLNVEHRWVPSGLWRWSEPEQTPRRALRAWPVDAEGEHYWMRLPWRVGDRLWVKETWRTSVCQDAVRAGIMETPGNGYGWPVWYEADGGAVTWRGSKGGGPGFEGRGKLRPSLFMARWASRLTLLVTEVRVEQLQDISHEDAAAEGLIAERRHADGILRSVATDECKGLTVTRWQGAPDLPLRGMERTAFRDLWERINGAESWKANPWVVAVSFSVHEGNIDKLAPVTTEVACA